jgi:class 3 adenylate cyclase
VLLAASTTEQAQCDEALEPRAAVPVKGYAEPVALFNLQDLAAA